MVDIYRAAKRLGKYPPLAISTSRPTVILQDGILRVPLRLVWLLPIVDRLQNLSDRKLGTFFECCARQNDLLPVMFF